jgi:GH24 family phage-related lysozyme (muramidase)
MNIPNVLARLKRFEGETDYLYRSTAGDLTAGIGHSFPGEASALAIPWQVGARAGTPQEISRDWHKIRTTPAGLVAAEYERLTSVRLAAGTVASLAERDITAVLIQLRMAIGGFDTFPEPAQEAIFDMGFNLGVAGLVKKFPRFLAAVDKGNWMAATAECQRLGVGPLRNRETAHLLLDSCTFS